MAITFDILKPEAKIFQELKKNPSWWARFKNDSSLYIEIRKDNQVNVYFEGGSVARIHYCSKHKKLQVFTHHKYLNLPAPSKRNAYIECSGIIDEPKETNSEILVCDKVIERVKTCYSQKHAINGIVDKEKWSEKFIQGTLITQSSDFHLDSEFAYNDATDKNRIDLIRCDKGVITFVELKRIADGRMLHKTDESPEIVDQMNRYKDFITKYSVELLAYYQKLYDVKAELGLPVPQIRPSSINPEPHLLIFDNWTKETTGRKIHRERLIDILNREKINFSIQTDL
ncbi:hypothetical protein [Prevotella sp. LMAG:51]|uniref:hypothetical protein n=1 Tax=Prevotella sp. LMAG:51 TaxID=1969564 RepID=UPI002580ACB6|nr:hypothetical protein [Prevotella sp. LMAG:51]